MSPVALYGCSLDPDEREQSIKRKVKFLLSSKASRESIYSDPYDVISKLIKLLKRGRPILRKGKVSVETWLTPFTLYFDLPLMSVSNFVAFIDSGGCYEYADKVYKFTEILPDIPFLVGVDHSMTEVFLRALSEIYNGNNILAIFIDSHFDAFSLPVRLGLIHYDIETNPRTIYRESDPYLYDRADSYNAESFIKFLANVPVPPLFQYFLATTSPIHIPPSKAQT